MENLLNDFGQELVISTSDVFHEVGRALKTAESPDFKDQRKLSHGQTFPRSERDGSRINGTNNYICMRSYHVYNERLENEHHSGAFRKTKDSDRRYYRDNFSWRRRPSGVSDS
jgi:hypothetical protein